MPSISGVWSSERSCATSSFPLCAILLGSTVPHRPSRSCCVDWLVGGRNPEAPNNTRVLPTIHMFWHGAPLSRLERLCMASFVANGHALDLYVYDEPAGVPSGVHLSEAGRILPRESLFLHRRTGSVGLFSDWSSYRL